MSYIFYIFSIFIILAITDVKSEASPTHSCKIGQVYTRTPTEKNNQTSFWCIVIHTSTAPIEYEDAADTCKLRYGQSAVVTIPENAKELESVQQRFQNWFNANAAKSSEWNIIVDGSLKPSCSPIGTCSPSASFETVNIQTDPTFIMNHWENDQPDNRTYNGIQKTCLGIDNKGYLRNIFCNLKSSPFKGADGKPKYHINGLVCGYPASP